MDYGHLAPILGGCMEVGKRLDALCGVVCRILEKFFRHLLAAQSSFHGCGAKRLRAESSYTYGDVIDRSATPEHEFHRNTHDSKARSGLVQFFVSSAGVRSAGPDANLAEDFPRA